MPTPVEPVPVPTQKGTIDLSKWRVRHRNLDGSISTIRSISFSDDKGYEILIPTFTPSGRSLSVNQAINQYYATGKHLGKFRTTEEANTYAEWLHNQEAKKLKGKK
jgi:hypothetical protein